LFLTCAWFLSATATPSFGGEGRGFDAKSADDRVKPYVEVNREIISNAVALLRLMINN
jgi:hypothetical protein